MTETTTAGLVFDAFDIAHAYLATLGACDSTGGHEYTRVRLEWETYPDGQRPDPIAFIGDRANIWPPDFASDYQPGNVTGEAFRARWGSNHESGRFGAFDALRDLIYALREEPQSGRLDVLNDRMAADSR